MRWWWHRRPRPPDFDPLEVHLGAGLDHDGRMIFSIYRAASDEFHTFTVEPGKAMSVWLKFADHDTGGK